MLLVFCLAIVKEMHIFICERYNTALKLLCQFVQLYAGALTH